MKLTFIVLLLLLAVSTWSANAIVDSNKLRVIASKNNVTCILVFGDSSVDPGNNNRLSTVHRGNFLPYGKDFERGTPTGRFSNGKLVTDFIAEALGYRSIIKAYLDPHLVKEDLLHGVSFASGGSGYDELTANFTKVISLTKQLEYFKEYKVRLQKQVGVGKAEEIVKNAVFVLSMGTNDFLQNYYVELYRSQQYTIDQYQLFLISCMTRYVQAMHTLGARRLAVVGMEPFGCMPLIKTLKGIDKCDDTFNQVALSFNTKIIAKLDKLKTLLGMRIAYLDIYTVIQNTLQNPNKYGFTVSSKGCAGTGTTEFGLSLKGLKTCFDHTKYIYWDAVHFTERMYTIIADEAVRSIVQTFY